ncbi:MAG: hypothetical protein K0R71_1860 [Bacillales bacterium]|nr:hypothetical protein [Bacillales bacterium]
MSNEAKKDCGCGENRNILPFLSIQQVEEPMQCTRTVHETVTAAAELIITPDISVTNIITSCKGDPIIRATFPENTEQECKFTVEQQVCAQFDVTFGVNADKGRTGLICGTPSTGPCNPPFTCPETSTLEHYTLAFLGVDSLPGGLQEWTYQFTNNSGHDLSHWTFVSCTETPVMVLAVTAETTEGDPISVTFEQTENPQGSIDCLTTTPQRPGVSITPESGAHPTGTTIIYHIITTQTYPVGTVLWGARAGQVVECGEICGPCIPTT